MEKYYDNKLNDYVIRASSPAWIVKEVQPQNDYTLLLTFADGEKKVYNAQHLLKKAIYAPLKSLAFFMSAKVCGDSVSWNDDIDIAPEHLYENSIEIRNNGNA